MEIPAQSYTRSYGQARRLTSSQHDVKTSTTKTIACYGDDEYRSNCSDGSLYESRRDASTSSQARWVRGACGLRSRRCFRIRLDTIGLVRSLFAP